MQAHGQHSIQAAITGAHLLHRLEGLLLLLQLRHCELGIRHLLLQRRLPLAERFALPLGSRKLLAKLLPAALEL